MPRYACVPKLRQNHARPVAAGSSQPPAPACATPSAMPSRMLRTRKVQRATPPSCWSATPAVAGGGALGEAAAAGAQECSCCSSCSCSSTFDNSRSSSLSKIPAAAVGVGTAALLPPDIPAASPSGS